MCVCPACKLTLLSGKASSTALPKQLLSTLVYEYGHDILLLHCGCRENVRFSYQVAVADVGAAAVAILTNPEPHKDKVYLINGPSADFNEDASAFPRTIGREVRYEQISYDEAQKFYVRKGMPEWQAKGLMELYRLVDEGQFNFPVRDFKHVTGHHPTNFEHWLASVKDQFE